MCSLWLVSTWILVYIDLIQGDFGIEFFLTQYWHETEQILTQNNSTWLLIWESRRTNKWKFVLWVHDPCLISNLATSYFPRQFKIKHNTKIHLFDHYMTTNGGWSKATAIKILKLFILFLRIQKSTNLRWKKMAALNWFYKLLDFGITGINAFHFFYSHFYLN